MSRDLGSERPPPDAGDPTAWMDAPTPPLGDTDESRAGGRSSTCLIAGMFPPPATPQPTQLEGTVVGGVRIGRLVGEGGMGRVYEGWSEELEQAFAVKIIRPGVADPALVSHHMKREAAILARLSHPGIARIFWFGTQELEGAQVPYFIMEYVANAKTITAFADHHKLSMRERLDLFRQVCDAVAAGHVHGVTHRDLKPLNILVDERGRPKVIDFGIARMTNADLTMTTMDATRLIGTPTHMSPEQFRGRESDIDVRTDVYALGVVLYQLLAGRLPFEIRDKPIYEIARTVIEEEPPTLSSLVPRLPRDVAVLAAQCLEKDKSLRYASAAELRDDVGRFLAGEPILAAPPSAWQSIRRFTRRHRAVTFAATGVVAAFLVAFVGILAFAIESRNQRLRTERVLDLAIRLLPGAVPRSGTAVDAEPGDGRISPAELLMRQRAEVETEKDQTARATLLHAIGNSLLDMGEFAEAADASRDAHTLWRAVRGEHAPESIASLSLLTTSLLCMENIRDAVTQAENLVAACQNRYDPGHPREVEARLLLARARRRAGDLAKALRITKAAVQDSTARNGPDARSTLVARNNLGVLYSQTGRFSDAIEHYGKAAMEATSRFGKDDRDALQFGHNLGVAHLRVAASGVGAAADRSRDEGIRTLEEVCQLRQDVLGQDHPDTLATLQELAKALLAHGLSAQAVSILVPCRDILERRAAAGNIAAREAFDLLVKARDAAARTQVADRLVRSPLRLGFTRDTLEHAVGFVAEEIDVPIEIEVGALQREGISKNQSFGLEERDEPACAILLTILRRADPQGRLVYVIRVRDGVASIEVTTRAAAERRGDELPPEFRESGQGSAKEGRR